LILHEIYSRETPNGIYKEAAKICLNNVEVRLTRKKRIGQM